MVALVVLLGATGLGLARVRLNTTVASFLPTGDRTVTVLDREQASFGADPIAVVLRSDKPAQLLSGAPLQAEIALEATLAHLPNVAVVYGPGTTLNEISRSLQDVLLDISGERDSLMARAESAAKARGLGAAAQQQAGNQAVVAFDQRYGPLLVQALQIGLPTTSNAALGSRVFLQADGQGQPAFRWLVPDADHVAILVRPTPGLTQDQTLGLVAAVHRAVAAAKLPVGAPVVSGYPVIVAALGHEITAELPLLAGLSLSVVAAGFVLLRRSRPLWERLLQLATGVAAAAVTVAGFGLAGVPLSLGLLAFLPIILGVGTDYPIYALRQGRPRVIIATAAASAASLAFLAVNPLPYVRDLGIALAGGLLASALLGVGVARALGPVRLGAEDTDPSRRRPGWGSRPVTPRWARSRVRVAVGDALRAVVGTVAATAARAGVAVGAAGRSVMAPLFASRRRAMTVAALAAVLAGVGWAGLGSLALNSDPERLAAGLPALRQGLAAQGILGAAGELDVSVSGANVLTPAYLAWYTSAQDVLLDAHGDQLRLIVSPASLLSWLGPDPTSSQIDAALSLLPAYLTDATIRADRTQAVMTFGVQLGSFGSDATLIHDITSELPPAPAGATVAVTGLPAVAARTYTLLSKDRVAPNVEGIVAFGLVLLALLPERRVALRAALAAAVAAGWGFALLHLTGTALTPLTVSLGSLTSAVGGEFTVMAMAQMRAGRPRPWSAVVAAAATSVAGFAVLSLSRLAVLRQFGLVLAGSVLLALLAAWVVVSVDRAVTRRRPEATGRPGDQPAPGSARQEVLV